MNPKVACLFPCCLCAPHRLVCMRRKPRLSTTAGNCSRPASCTPPATQFRRRGFTADGWLKTSVPSTVLAAQVAAGVFPDPYFGDNLRQIPGTDLSDRAQLLPICPWRPTAPIAAAGGIARSSRAPAPARKDERFWLHFGGINYRGEVWVNGHKIADSTTVAGAYRTYDFDVTDAVEAGQSKCARRGNVRADGERSRHQLGRLEPLPARQRHGPVGRRRPGEHRPGHCAFADWRSRTFTTTRSNTADLTVYAELHNARDQSSERRRLRHGRGSALRAAGGTGRARRPHRRLFSPEQFPHLRIHNPKPWWPLPDGRAASRAPHHEFQRQRPRRPTSRAWTSASARSRRSSRPTAAACFA